MFKTSIALLSAACVCALAAACATTSSLPQQPHALPPSVPLVAESAPPASKYLADTWKGIFLYQKFDNYNNGQHVIPPAQAVADGPRYILVWGSSTAQMIQAWETNNPSVFTTYYQPFETDLSSKSYGLLGHDLSWWQANHPDRILYECDKITPAWIAGLPTLVPLDISNPAVVQYQMHLIGPYAEQSGYTGVSADLLTLTNGSGGQNGGTRGCGIWTTDAKGQPLWVQKFSGNRVDPAWAAAAQAWTIAAQNYLHARSRPLSLFGNISFSYPLGDAGLQQLISHLDVAQNEPGFTGYGNHLADDGVFRLYVAWGRYVQQQGKGFLLTSLWPATSTIGNSQIDYSLATYLMVKEQASALFTAQFGTEGEEHYFPQYQASIGVPCGEMYGGPKYRQSGEYVYYRQFARALAIVNTSSTATYTVNLPKPSYTSIDDGLTIKSPLTIGPDVGNVLLTTNGCQ